MKTDTKQLVLSAVRATTASEIAKATGVSRSTVSRKLKELVADGLVKLDGKLYVVAAPKKAEKAAGTPKSETLESLYQELVERGYDVRIASDGNIAVRKLQALTYIGVNRHGKLVLHVKRNKVEETVRELIPEATVNGWEFHKESNRNEVRHVLKALTK